MKNIAIIILGPCFVRSDLAYKGILGVVMNQELTERQQREIKYHVEHAKQYDHAPIDWDLIHNEKRRWWNQAWSMWTQVIALNPSGKRSLVVDCGFGEDAFYLSKLGARVHAFDISPDTLAIARETAKCEGLDIEFSRMPAEKRPRLPAMGCRKPKENNDSRKELIAEIEKELAFRQRFGSRNVV